MRSWRFRLNIVWVFGILAVLFLAGCTDPEPLVKPRIYPTGWKDRSIRPFPYEQVPDDRPDGQDEASVYIGPRMIVIDPGHGGRDPGTQGLSEHTEKVIVLAIAKELNRILTFRGTIPMMTRSGDRFIKLSSRAVIAEQNKADLFVSIHADYSIRSNVHGATVLIGRTASGNSKRAAAKIKSALQRAGIATRPIRPQNLRVLEDHSRPAVLIECGFLSNSTEAINLNTKEYQRKVAQAIADGISDYFSR